MITGKRKCGSGQLAWGLMRKILDGENMRNLKDLIIQKKTMDVEYNYPFGWKEMFGLAYRTDFDLKNHSKFSGKDLSYRDQITGEEYIPHVIEPTFGLSRLVGIVLFDAYCEEEVNGQKRVFLKINPKIAPVKAAVFPLLANKENLVKIAKEIYQNLKKDTREVIVFDDRGNIGKRYFAQDEIGTPFCITVDFKTPEDESVTVRDRDTMKQERVKVSELPEVLKKKYLNLAPRAFIFELAILT